MRGRWLLFDDYREKIKYVPVAQLDSACDSDSQGRRFESCRAYQKEEDIAYILFFFVEIVKMPVF